MRNTIIHHKKGRRTFEVEMVPRTELHELTPESLSSYREYMELNNMLRDKLYYSCPFCGKCYKHVRPMFNHLEKIHEAY